MPLNHEQLWAPWRLAYVTGDRPAPPQDDERLRWLPGADRDCFLCRGVADDRDRQNLIVDRQPLVVTVLNRFPYNNGHLLVAPLRHIGRLNELTSDEHLAAMTELTLMVGVLERFLKAEGFNVGLNLGRVAGAGLPGHLHWHVVPRWNGDTNFMPALAGVRVIPQSLDALWEFLREQLAPGDALGGQR